MRRSVQHFLQQYLQALIEEDQDQFTDSDEEEEEVGNGEYDQHEEVDDDYEEDDNDNDSREEGDNHDDDDNDDGDNVGVDDDGDEVMRDIILQRRRQQPSVRRRPREEVMREYAHKLEERKQRLAENDIVHLIRKHSYMETDKNDNYNESSSKLIRRHLGSNPQMRSNILVQLNERRSRHDKFNKAEKIAMTQGLLPNFSNGPIDTFDHQVFCGQFSDDGSIFMSACQDQVIRLYNFDQLQYATSKKKRAKPFKTIHARDVGWSVVGVDYSPDRKFIIYSSWSPFVHLAAVDTMSDYHEGLDLDPGTFRFCAFSVRFSPDSREILAGASDNNLYLYDLETKKRVLKVDAHGDDVNTVCFADKSGDVFYSGSDDTYCKVWDRRTLGRESNSKPVGTLVGHASGITCISSKGDARYFISNGKDQALKLWDIRAMKSYPDNQIPKIVSRASAWDYRYQIMSSRYTQRISKHDTSLMTFTGHRVLQTLIRCNFSPMDTTGQRYIYTGSHDGIVYIYDILTGDIVQKLVGHSGVIRDVSWHPRSSDLLSTSWDGSVIHWSYTPVNSAMDNELEVQDSEADQVHEVSRDLSYNTLSSDDDEEEEDYDDDDELEDFEEIISVYMTHEGEDEEDEEEYEDDVDDDDYAE